MVCTHTRLYRMQQQIQFHNQVALAGADGAGAAPADAALPDADKVLGGVGSTSLVGATAGAGVVVVLPSSRFSLASRNAIFCSVVMVLRRRVVVASNMMSV